MSGIITGIELIASYAKELESTIKIKEINPADHYEIIYKIENLKELSIFNNEISHELCFKCFQPKLKEETKNKMLSNIQSIVDNCDHVKNINTLMLMTINRCIDYTKASNGVELIPKYEKIKLSEIIENQLHALKICKIESQSN